MIPTHGDNKRKHLDMIQGIINRMASNSFLFKGWSITIIAGISAFAAKDANPALMAIPFASSLLFWGVDGYYLMLERAFRRLYNEVILKDEADIDYKMSIDPGERTVSNWLKTVFTRPVLISFYSTLIIMLICLAAALNRVRIEVIIHHGS